jgi:hypothetical protein
MRGYPRVYGRVWQSAALGRRLSRYKEDVMRATIRSYTDPDLADMLASNKGEVEALLAAVPGVQSYFLIRTPEGCTSVTVGEDETATSASAKAAADYLHSKGAAAAPPTVASGEVLAHVGAGVTA